MTASFPFARMIPSAASSDVHRVNPVVRFRIDSFRPCPCLPSPDVHAGRRLHRIHGGAPLYRRILPLRRRSLPGFWPFCSYSCSHFYFCSTLLLIVSGRRVRSHLILLLYSRIYVLFSPTSMLGSFLFFSLFIFPFLLFIPVDTTERRIHAQSHGRALNQAIIFSTCHLVSHGQLTSR